MSVRDDAAVLAAPAGRLHTFGMAGSSVATQLELLVLAVVAPGPRSGYGVARQTAARSGCEPGELEARVHDTLHRLERCGLVRSRRAAGARGPRRLYEVTRAGRARLASERRVWLLLARAFARAV
jgi:PadR family transcriptional regulator PadR